MLGILQKAFLGYALRGAVGYNGGPSAAARIGWGPGAAARTGWGAEDRLGKLLFGKLYSWEVATWENSFGKVTNI